MKEQINVPRHSRLGTTLMIILFFVPISTPLFGQSQKSITGKVAQKNGEPLELVHVQIEGTSYGAVTDQEGYFEIPAPENGEQTLIVSLIGYETLNKEITIHTSTKNYVEITLHKKLENLQEVEVTAGSFTTGNAEGVTLSPLEVVTTPGAAADIFRAIKSFPGVSNIDEGSGLFVRGGDVSETKIMLDQATVVHPYKYETPTGGVFGTIPPFLVSGTYFSSGGFSAKYGNALSGVLAMESQGMPNSRNIELNLGMAAASLGFSVPVIDNKLGLRFSGNRSFTQFLFDVNGISNEFKQAPLGLDGNLSIIYKPNSGSTIKFFNFRNQNEVGVRTNEPSFDGLFSSDEQNRLHNLQWTQLWGDWLLESSFSFNKFKSKSELGGFNLDEQDKTYKIRTDLEKHFSNDFQINAGAEWEYTENGFTGSVPDQENIVDPNASFTALDEQYGAARTGGYVELETKLSRRLLAKTGIRTDLQTQTNEFVFDPRLSLLYQLSDASNIRLATGLYHQFAEPFKYNLETGNPELKSQKAWHYILGFEHQKNLLHFRVETYYKDYDRLIIEGNTNELTNRGFGKAYGADLFLKYSKYLQTPFSGWVSYSFLNSDRFQPRQESNQLSFETAPSDFDITHNLNVVGKAQIIGTLSLGASYRFSTGRPFTPVVDSQLQQSAGYYQPVEGPVNSKRLPSFHRLDLDLNYFWQFDDRKSVVFYVSVSNILNRKNVTDVSYKKDYSQRSFVESNYSRSIYAGVSLDFGF